MNIAALNVLKWLFGAIICLKKMVQIQSIWTGICNTFYCLQFLEIPFYINVTASNKLDFL